MPQLHKGKHYPFNFRRDLWNGFQWAYRWPETLQLTFSNFVGTYGLMANTTPPQLLSWNGDDPSLMEINYGDFISIGTIHRVLVDWGVYIDTDKQPASKITMRFPDGTVVTNWEPFRPGFQTTTLGQSALIVASGGNLVSSNYTKWSTVGGHLSRFNWTGAPW